MRSRRRAAGPILAGLFAALTLFPAEPLADDDAAFVDLLDRLGRMARLYADTALRFSCDETMKVRSGVSFSDSYIYVFGEDGAFHDYRARPGDRKGREIEPAHIPIPTFLNQAYSWVFQFRAERRGRIRYTLKGEEAALGVPAVAIVFEPILPIEPGINDWYGTAWVDPRTAQILKVEALQSADDDVRRQVEAARGQASGDTRQFRLSTVTTEFGIVKNGLRFPSLAVIESRVHTLPNLGMESVDIDYHVEQRYTNYRFFSVRSADEIERLTRGLPSPLPPPFPSPPP
jgi:hypothetical protein